MNTNTVTTDHAALAASLTDWWALAGVDVAVQETPRNWLSADTPPAPLAAPDANARRLGQDPKRNPEIAATIAPDPAPPEPVRPDPMPDDRDAFLSWLEFDAHQPEAAFSVRRILPHLVPDAAIMVVTDMPTAEDMVAGRLFSNGDHILLGGMLRAIGISPDKASLASLLLARPAGGIIEDGLADQAALRLRHFIEMIRPPRLILLGDRTGRAFAQTNGGSAASGTPGVNHPDGMISAMLLPAPAILLKHPERKAAAWGQLRYLAARQ